MKRVNVKAILADADLRRKLMVSTIQATQAREGIETTAEQADRAYYVINEGEKAAFIRLFDVRPDRNAANAREVAFTEVLRGNENGRRVNIARGDFSSIATSPLAYQHIGLVGSLFREFPAVYPQHGSTHVGVFTHDDERFIRERWEMPSLTSQPWVRFWKGGEYSRFYYDSSLVLDWSATAQLYYRAHGRIRDPDLYFKGGLTWVPRTQRGFSLRVLPREAIFGNKGPTLLPKREGDLWYLLGVGNSRLFEFLTQTLAAFGSYEAASIARLPIPQKTSAVDRDIENIPREIHDAKATWDAGNEVSARFVGPWVLEESGTLPNALSSLREREEGADKCLSDAFSRLNEAVYRLYGISIARKQMIEATLGQRPGELLWPQMEGKTADQKRMEHIWRLLSYAVKRVIEADDDGIVPFNAVNGEPRLVERVRHELAQLFPDRDASQVEVEIVNELNQTVKGYRRCASLGAWLDNAYFEYHCGLYKSRPIFWHIASAQGTARFAFGALVHYHRFDKNRLAKLRATYLRDAVEEFRREAGLADRAGATADRLEWQTKLEEAQALDVKLQAIQEGRHEGAEGGDRDLRILTPWKTPQERPKGWNPDLDDGVKVNIEPLQKAGVLRIAKVI